MSEPIEAIVGQMLQIALQSMAGSTGYGWYLSKIDGGLVLLDASIQPTAPGIAPVKHIFDFLAVEAGTFNLEFELIAPWRPGEPADTKSYEVTVRIPEKTAAEDIETSMKGQSFVGLSDLNADTTTILKYAAPITAVVKYAAPMSQPPTVNNDFSAYPNVIYAAPMVQPPAVNTGFGAYPVVVYAAPMSQPPAANAGFGAPPNVIYAAPMVQPPVANTGFSAYPVVVYAAPMSQTPTANAGFGAYPNVIYAAPMVQPLAVNTGFSAYPVVVYAAPMPNMGYQTGGNIPVMAQPFAANQNFQPLYAAPMTQVIYAAPMSRPGCC